LADKRYWQTHRLTLLTYINALLPQQLGYAPAAASLRVL